MQRILVAACLGGAVLVSSFGFPAVSKEQDGKTTPAYAASRRADRIFLMVGADPAREMTVTFRTDVNQLTAEAQIASALDGPGLEQRARTVGGESQMLVTSNGRAMHHQVRFKGLRPNQTYAYRVRSAAGWSEWLQFRTARGERAPFRFLYFGDVQNDILDNGARTVRQALASTSDAALMIHAGDLVAQSLTSNHDDEWGEWAETGGYAFAMIPQLPAAGNHEYVAGDRGQELGQHWSAQFALPANGAEGLTATTYFVDYQGVRFIMLDGTAALADPAALHAQTAWLERILPDRNADWTVVTLHQPIFTCARPRDTEILNGAWRPIFEERGVDLVLQGHDHCYSRLSHPDGRVAGEAARHRGASQGPVYVVSVAGPKMYGLNGRAGEQPDRVAADTQLYQLVEVSQERLSFKAFTAAGTLYDAFALERRADGSKVHISEHRSMAPVRVCRGDDGPDGLPCFGRDLSELK